MEAGKGVSFAQESMKRRKARKLQRDLAAQLHDSKLHDVQASCSESELAAQLQTSAEATAPPTGEEELAMTAKVQLRAASKDLQRLTRQREALETELRVCPALGHRFRAVVPITDAAPRSAEVIFGATLSELTMSGADSEQQLACTSVTFDAACQVVSWQCGETQFDGSLARDGARNTLRVTGSDRTALRYEEVVGQRSMLPEPEPEQPASPREANAAREREDLTWQLHGRSSEGARVWREAEGRATARGADEFQSRALKQPPPTLVGAPPKPVRAPPPSGGSLAKQESQRRKLRKLHRSLVKAEATKEARLAGQAVPVLTEAQSEQLLAVATAQKHAAHEEQMAVMQEELQLAEGERKQLEKERIGLMKSIEFPGLGRRFVAQTGEPEVPEITLEFGATLEDAVMLRPEIDPSHAAAAAAAAEEEEKGSLQRNSARAPPVGDDRAVEPERCVGVAYDAGDGTLRWRVESEMASLRAGTATFTGQLGKTGGRNVLHAQRVEDGAVFTFVEVVGGRSSKDRGGLQAELTWQLQGRTAEEEIVYAADMLRLKERTQEKPGAWGSTNANRASRDSRTQQAEGVTFAEATSVEWSGYSLTPMEAAAVSAGEDAGVSKFEKLQAALSEQLHEMKEALAPFQPELPSEWRNDEPEPAPVPEPDLKLELELEPELEPEPELELEVHAIDEEADEVIEGADHVDDEEPADEVADPMEEVGDEPDDMEEAVVEDGGPELEPEPEPELDLEPAAEDDGYGDEGFEEPADEDDNDGYGEDFETLQPEEDEAAGPGVTFDVVETLSERRAAARRVKQEENAQARIKRAQVKLQTLERHRQIAETEAAAIQRWELAQVEQEKVVALRRAERKRKVAADAARETKHAARLARASAALAGIAEDGAKRRKARAVLAARVLRESQKEEEAAAVAVAEAAAERAAAIARWEESELARVKKMAARENRKAAAARVAATRASRKHEERKGQKKEEKEERERKAARKARMRDHVDARRLMEERWGVAKAEMRAAAAQEVRPVVQEQAPGGATKPVAPVSAEQKGLRQRAADLLSELPPPEATPEVDEEEREQMERNADNIEFEALNESGSILTLLKYTIISHIRSVLCIQLEHVCSTEEELPEPEQQSALLKRLLELEEDGSCPVESAAALQAAMAWPERVAEQRERAAAEAEAEAAAEDQLRVLTGQLATIAAERQALEAEAEGMADAEGVDLGQEDGDEPAAEEWWDDHVTLMSSKSAARPSSTSSASASRSVSWAPPRVSQRPPSQLAAAGGWISPLVPPVLRVVDTNENSPAGVAPVRVSRSTEKWHGGDASVGELLSAKRPAAAE